MGPLLGGDRAQGTVLGVVWGDVHLSPGPEPVLYQDPCVETDRWHGVRPCVHKLGPLSSGRHRGLEAWTPHRLPCPWHTDASTKWPPSQPQGGGCCPDSWFKGNACRQASSRHSAILCRQPGVTYAPCLPGTCYSCSSSRSPEHPPGSHSHRGVDRAGVRGPSSAHPALQASPWPMRVVSPGISRTQDWSVMVT